jgi:hypothetical protein
MGRRCCDEEEFLNCSKKNVKIVLAILYAQDQVHSHIVVGIKPGTEGVLAYVWPNNSSPGKVMTSSEKNTQMVTDNNKQLSSDKLPN